MHRAGAAVQFEFETVHPVEPDPVDRGAIGIEIGQRRRVSAGIPFLAVHRAGMATDADIEVDHQAQALFAAELGQAGHRFSPGPRKVFP